MCEVNLTNVSFAYSRQPVLANVSMTIAAGEFLAVFGPNGAGKSTLMKIIAGLLPPDTGLVQVGGKSVAAAQQQGLIRYVPQNYAKNTVDFPITVEEVVALGVVSSNKVPSRQAVQHIVGHMLTLMQIPQLRKRRIGELSGGQQQRVMVAAALAGNPRLLLLDEPTSGIDYAASQKIYELLGELNRNLGITVIMVSHDIDKAAHWVTQVACINQGLCFLGSSEEFRATHAQGRHSWYEARK